MNKIIILLWAVLVLIDIVDGSLKSFDIWSIGRLIILIFWIVIYLIERHNVNSKIEI
jgi:hypothetical protein